MTLPLSLPGVFAGTLLTFIPAAGDFINAQLLGSPTNHMIGNVIQSKFLELTDYPAAASMSFILMAAILVAVVAFALVSAGAAQAAEGFWLTAALLRSSHSAVQGGRARGGRSPR